MEDFSCCPTLKVTRGRGCPAAEVPAEAVESADLFGRFFRHDKQGSNVIWIHRKMAAHKRMPGLVIDIDPEIGIDVLVLLHTEHHNPANPAFNGRHIDPLDLVLIGILAVCLCAD
jgi:hypothetical protein